MEPPGWETMPEVLLLRSLRGGEAYEDTELYREAYEEAQRIIRISEEVRISMKPVPQDEPVNDAETATDESESGGKLTSSRLAKKLKLKNVAELHERLVSAGLLETKDDKHCLSEKGKDLGAEFRNNQYGGYFLWPENLQP